MNNHCLSILTSNLFTKILKWTLTLGKRIEPAGTRPTLLQMILQNWEGLPETINITCIIPGNV